MELRGKKKNQSLLIVTKPSGSYERNCTWLFRMWFSVGFNNRNTLSRC